LFYFVNSIFLPHLCVHNMLTRPNRRPPGRPIKHHAFAGVVKSCRTLEIAISPRHKYKINGYAVDLIHKKSKIFFTCKCTTDTLLHNSATGDAMKNFFEPEPVIFTTGGAEPGLAEDTVHNFKKAAAHGSHVIRTNVVFTGDEKFIVASDAVFQQGAIMHTGFDCFNLNDLRKEYRETAHPDGPINGEKSIFPELSLVLESFPRQRFNFNLIQKNGKLTLEFCNILDRMHAVGRVLVSSFRSCNFRVVRTRLPAIATSFSFPGIIGFYTLFKSGLLYYRHAFKSDAMIIPEMIGASLLANEGLIQRARSLGIHVYVLGVDNEERARGLFQDGVNGFVTNNIEMIKRVTGIT
jgi:glycerophosphoryl diester phosphodiesterase